MRRTVIPVCNLTRVLQVHGHYRLKPGEWVDLPPLLAERLAGNPDYRVDSRDLLSRYKFRETDGLHLGWSSPLHYADGYGSIGQEIAATYLDMGIKLSLIPRDYTPTNFGGFALDDWHRKAFVPEVLVERLHRPLERCFYGFNMTWPREVHRHPFVRGFGYTMFETTLPPRIWAETMNKCRRMVVPCEQNKTAFQDIGVTVPIHVAQLGVNPDAWPYIDRSRIHGTLPFTFLMAAGLTYRKNPVGAAEAFVAAFPSDPDVRLVFKTRDGGAFRHWAQCLPPDDRIQVVSEESTPPQMLNWMHVADAFVFPSHGEGFGLTPLQAMSTGLPTIVADNSGMSEYCDNRYNYPIPCCEIPVPKAPNPAAYPADWGDVGNWWDPDFDAVVAAYREIRRHPARAFAKGRKAADWVREQWTVRDTCERLLAVVMEDAREDGLL